MTVMVMMMTVTTVTATVRTVLVVMLISAHDHTCSHSQRTYNSYSTSESGTRSHVGTLLWQKE